MYISVKIISRNGGGAIVFRALQSKNGERPSCIEVYASTDMPAALLEAFIKASSSKVLKAQPLKTTDEPASDTKNKTVVEAKKKARASNKRGFEQMSLVNKEKSTDASNHMDSSNSVKSTKSISKKIQKKTCGLIFYSSKSNTSSSAGISDTAPIVERRSKRAKR